MFIDGITSSLTAYQLVQKNDAKFEAGFAKRKDFSIDVDYYKANISKVTSPDALLKDRRMLYVALSAFGLEDRIDAKALVKKLLTEDPTASTSVASKLTDQRFKAFATAFASLKSDGGKGIASASSIASVTKAYQTNEYEKMLGDANPAIREALYFQRSIGAVGSNTKLTDKQKMLAIITDKTFDKVVVGALGMPSIVAGNKATQQESAFTKAKLDVNKLSDPAYVTKLVQQYLVNTDRKAAAANDPTGGVGGLFAPTDNSASNNFGIIDLQI